MERIRYGTTYSLADFCDRLIPKDRPTNNRLVKGTFEGLKRLALVQNENPWVTMQATLSAGVWVHYKGRPYCLINLAKEFLRVGASWRHEEAAEALRGFFHDLIEAGVVTEVPNPALSQWRVPPEGLPRLWEFFEQLPRPQAGEETTETVRHPRTFPGEDRQAALETFIREGRICRGVDGLIPPHKLDEGEPIEFDHVIPHARGGASTYQNLAILCVACNRAKGATAL